MPGTVGRPSWVRIGHLPGVSPTRCSSSRDRSGVPDKDAVTPAPSVPAPGASPRVTPRRFARCAAPPRSGPRWLKDVPAARTRRPSNRLPRSARQAWSRTHLRPGNRRRSACPCSPPGPPAPSTPAPRKTRATPANSTGPSSSLHRSTRQACDRQFGGRSPPGRTCVYPPPEGHVHSPVSAQVHRGLTSGHSGRATPVQPGAIVNWRIRPHRRPDTEATVRVRGG